MEKPGSFFKNLVVDSDIMKHHLPTSAQTVPLYGPANLTTRPYEEGLHSE